MECFLEELKHAGGRQAFFDVQLLFYLKQYSLPLCEVWRVLLKQSALQRMGFVFHRPGLKHYATGLPVSTLSSSSFACDSATYFLWEADAEDAFDEFQARKLWQLACGLCKHRSISMAQWRCLPPMQFIGLLCRTSDKVAEALEEQELNWKTLIACEKLHSTEPEIQKLLKAMPWVQNDVCREVLTMLAQHDFKHVQAPARSLVTAMFRGPNHSAHVENMFQHLKDFSQDVSNGMSSRAKRMYHCVQSNLLADFDLPEVFAAATQAEPHNSRLPKSTWEATRQGCSLDDKLLKTLLEDSGKAFPSPSAQSAQLHCAARSLLCNCWKKNTLSSAGDAWHALPMPEESVVRRTVGSSCCIVLKSSPYGALVWPAQERVAKGVKVLMPDMQAGSKASWLPVLPEEGWKALPTQPIPPYVLKVPSASLA